MSSSKEDEIKEPILSLAKLTIEKDEEFFDSEVIERYDYECGCISPMYCEHPKTVFNKFGTERNVHEHIQTLKQNVSSLYDEIVELRRVIKLLIEKVK